MPLLKMNNTIVTFIVGLPWLFTQRFTVIHICCDSAQVNLQSLGNRIFEQSDYGLVFSN